jgi:hypothetical protein
VLYNILIEFEVRMKLVRPIKMSYGYDLQHNSNAEYLYFLGHICCRCRDCFVNSFYA